MESAIKVNAEREGLQTVLKESFHSAPYKLTYYGSPTFHEHLEMIIMSASPGVMDEDILNIDIHVKKAAQLKMYTQSFNKVHPMKSGAYQNTRAVVEKNAILQYIPHPVTPFKDSIFNAKNELHLDKDGVLIWGDIICSGRVHMDESFVFTRLHTVSKLYRNKKLIYVDNQFLSPKQQPIQKLLFFEGYTHQATLIFSASFARELKLELDEILAQEYEDITYGFTQPAEDIVLFRALGTNGELLYDFLLMLGQLCWEFSQYQLEALEPVVEEPGVPQLEMTPPEAIVDTPVAVPKPPKKKLQKAKALV